MTGLDPRQSFVQRAQQTHRNAKYEVSQLLCAQLLCAQLLYAQLLCAQLLCAQLLLAATVCTIASAGLALAAL